ncbi:MAG: hypothetical protein IJ880_00480 [Bacilli bacterium]|nr:hypothetical protein [Bacilli bacterium]
MKDLLESLIAIIIFMCIIIPVIIIVGLLTIVALFTISIILPFYFVFLILKKIFSKK